MEKNKEYIENIKLYEESGIDEDEWNKTNDVFLEFWKIDTQNGYIIQ